MSRSRPEYLASVTSMWSRKGTPVFTAAVPFPRWSCTRIWVSRVSRMITLIEASESCGPVSLGEFLGDDARIQRAGVQRHADDRRRDPAVGERAQVVHRG